MRGGESASSLFGPLNVHIVCLDPQKFIVLVFRTFGRELFEMVVREGLEFGVEVQ